MKSFIYSVLAVFSLSLLASCANENAQPVHQDKAKANAKGYDYAPSSSAPANLNANQNNASTTASKMISPVTY